MGDRKGFLGALFDLSFTEFVTVRVVKVLYVLTLVLLVIGYIAVAVVAFIPQEQAGTINAAGDFVVERKANVGIGVLWVVLIGPLLLFLYTLLYRVFYELIIVVFRIYENTRDQLELTRRSVEREPPLS